LKVPFQAKGIPKPTPFKHAHLPAQHAGSATKISKLNGLESLDSYSSGGSPAPNARLAKKPVNPLEKQRETYE